MTRVDWIAVGIAVLSALAGLRRGLIATVFSFAGVAAGAVIGARVAPHFLHGGASSPYTSVAALAGAIVGAAVLQAVGAMAGSSVRRALFVVPPLRALDSAGGFVAGAVLGFAMVWILAAAILQLPGQPKLRNEVLGSAVVQRLNELAPPRTVLRALDRIDPLPLIEGPAPPSAPPDRRALASAAVAQARPSVVRITAIACGFGVEGTGWVARPHLVVTAAHVVAGASGIRAQGHVAVPLLVDRTHDLAVLRVSRLSAPALPVADPRPGTSVAILGFPENGPFDARPGRIGTTADVLIKGDLREVTAVSGLVRHGNSGGPAVDAAGRVEATIFAARIGAKGGYGIPASSVRSALARARSRVSTGGCG